MLNAKRETDKLEKELEQLLRQLKEARRKEVGKFWSDKARLEILDKVIKDLENSPLDSIADFCTVKNWFALELLFKESAILKKYCFPCYKNVVESRLLCHASMDVYLDKLEAKSNNLRCRGYILAACEAKWLVFELRSLNQWYFSEERLTYSEYQARAFQAIQGSLLVLGQHRGCKFLLINLSALIFTAGIAFLLNKVCTGKFLFFQKTDSASYLDKLGQMVNAAHPEFFSLTETVSINYNY